MKPPHSSIPSDVMTVEQVAAYLQLNKLTLYKYIREGRLPASRLGKVYRVRQSDVDAFLESQKIRPAVKATRTAKAAAPRPEEIAVAPPPRHVGVAELREVRLNPMEWMSRGLN